MVGSNPLLVQGCVWRTQAHQCQGRDSRIVANVPRRLPSSPLPATIDNFFEWKAIKGAKTKQPYAIAIQSGKPFALAAIWDNWMRPSTGEWVRTFCVIICPTSTTACR
jgi:hypothetical protein